MKIRITNKKTSWTCPAHTGRVQYSFMPCIILVEILWAQDKGMYLHLCIVSASDVLYMLECAFV